VIPPRVQFFLWLLSHNRLLTRDNLAKRQEIRDRSCIFCAEHESICHLFFDCCIGTNTWKVVSEFLGTDVGSDFESVARFWLAHKRHVLTNAISSAILWSIWKLRNEIYFQGVRWTGLPLLFLKTVRMLRRWIPLFKQEMGAQVEDFARRLEIHASSPPQLQWKTDMAISSSGLAPSDARRSVTNVHLAQNEVVFAGRCNVASSSFVSLDDHMA